MIPHFFKKIFMTNFYGWGSTASRLQSHYKETVYFLPLPFAEPQKYESLNRDFFIVCQRSYYQSQIKVPTCQSDSRMTLNFELCQSELTRICFVFTYVDQMITQQRFNA